VLQYQVRWGAAMKTWQIMIDQGREPPPQFFEQPELALDLVGIMDAFCDLSTERQIGMTLGSIPVSKTKEYAAELELDGDELDRFCTLIVRMDAEYLKPAVKPDPRERATARIDDPRAMKEFMLNLQARKKAVADRKKR
jgi:hypothetical protein